MFLILSTSTKDSHPAITVTARVEVVDAQVQDAAFFSHQQPGQDKRERIAQVQVAAGRGSDARNGCGGRHGAKIRRGKEQKFCKTPTTWILGGFNRRDLPPSFSSNQVDGGLIEATTSLFG